MHQPEEKELFEKVKNDDVKAFEALFHHYYGFLCAYAFKYTNNHHAAEEIVQDLFVEIWEKRAQLTIRTSLKSYLFQSVRNRCLNLFQHQKTRTTFAEKFRSEFNPVSDEEFVEINLADKIEKAIDSLPEKRREVFRLSREEGLKYREIAQKLNLSIKTVETHMALAIAALRDKLKKYRF